MAGVANHRRWSLRNKSPESYPFTGKYGVYVCDIRRACCSDTLDVMFPKHITKRDV